ncbi:ferritin-like domain-containing protein [Thiohalorhabdus sp. Cl-TMA]|uniref:Bacterioferritin n=1 Tax=Thiohalorhabdus methylotrophus TaxID=3242694 RepID=A0ABV4TX65_9GAMM
MSNSDTRVPGFLGRALSFELSAVQQYLTHARLAEGWGLTGAASRLRQEAQQETGHADRIVARMLALGMAPNASFLRPVVTGQDLMALLRANWRLEAEIVRLYEQAYNHCARSRDPDGLAFFGELLREEQEHARELEGWLNDLSEPNEARRPGSVVTGR